MDKKPRPKQSKASKVPIIRGIINFVKQMVVGVKALMYSADFADVDDKDAEPSKFDKFIEKALGDKAKDAVIYIAVILGCLQCRSFILLPNFITGRYFPGAKMQMYF